jgi:arabinose-5-phosphate isomerase
MTSDPNTIGPDALVADAIALFDEYKITSLFVVEGVEGNVRPIGVVHIHDCPSGR